MLTNTNNYSRTNVVFLTNGGNVMANAGFQVADNGAGGRLVSKIEFKNSNGVTFGEQSSTDTGGRIAVITASVAAPGIVVSGTDSVQATRLAFIGGVTVSTAAGAATASVGNRALSFYRNGERVSGEVNTLAVSTALLWVNPFMGGELFPAPMTAGTFEMMHSFATMSASNSTHGFTIRGGVYTLANSTQLTRVNSFSFSTSYTTTAAANLSVRAASFGGIRWIQLSTSNWSSSPVFSEGVQYWMASNIQSGGQAGINNGMGQLAMGFVGGDYRGTLNVSATTHISSRILPMAGAVATTSPPASIGSAAFVASEANGSGWLPFFQFRDSVYQ